MQSYRVLNTQFVIDRTVRALVHTLESGGEVGYGVEILTPSPAWGGAFKSQSEAYEHIQERAKQFTPQRKPFQPSPTEGEQTEGEPTEEGLG